MAQGKKKNKKITVLGYGSQGRAIAQNLKDSGYDVTVALKSGSSSRRKAKSDGIKNITTVKKAVSEGEVFIFALADHLQGEIYKTEIAPNLNAGSTLVFLHGFSVHFGFVVPPKECDVILIAPHAPGVAVRQKYLGERSISAFSAVYQDYSKKAKRKIIELAEAVGFDRKRLVKTTFEHEALGDLFGEQAVLCGGMPELIMAGYNTLVKNNIPEENAYLEVCYQLDLIVELIKKHGIRGMYDRISVAAKVGSVESGSKIIDKSVQKRMDLLFKSIKSGDFAKRLNRLSDSDKAKTDKKITNLTKPGFENSAKKYSK